MACLMVVGNCARKDENCDELIEKYNLLSFLKDLVLEEESTQIQHLAIGALNNLSIPLANRSKIVKFGFLAHLLTVVQQKEKRNAHVLFGAGKKKKYIYFSFFTFFFFFSNYFEENLFW